MSVFWRALAELNNARQIIQCMDEDAVRCGLDKLREVAEMIDSMIHPKCADVIIVIKGNDDGHVVSPPLRSSWTEISQWTANTVLSAMAIADGVTIYLNGLEVEPVVLTVGNLIYRGDITPDRVVMTVYAESEQETVIPLDDDGRFLKRWPEGFSVERRKLLDGELL